MSIRVIGILFGLAATLGVYGAQAATTHIFDGERIRPRPQTEPPAVPSTSRISVARTGRH